MDSIISITHMHQVDEVPSFQYVRDQQESWLKQWTCANNFESLIVEQDSDFEQDLLLLLYQAYSVVNAHYSAGFNPQNFAVTVYRQNLIRYNRFTMQPQVGQHKVYKLADYFSRLQKMDRSHYPTDDLRLFPNVFVDFEKTKKSAEVLINCVAIALLKQIGPVVSREFLDAFESDKITTFEELLDLCKGTVNLCTLESYLTQD